MHVCELVSRLSRKQRRELPDYYYKTPDEQAALERDAANLMRVLETVNGAAVASDVMIPASVSYHLYPKGGFRVTLDMPDKAIVDAVKAEFDGDPDFIGRVDILPPNELFLTARGDE